MKTRGSKYSLRCMVMNASQSLNARNLLAATTRGHSISRKVCGVCGSILELRFKSWERTVGSPNINTGRSVAPKPPVVVRAAFQFVSTPFFF